MSLVAVVVLFAACDDGDRRRFKIPSSGMAPTFAIGDRIVIATDRRRPERGEVIVFQHPCTMDKDFVQRVIAVAGDTVEVRCGTVYVNGEAVPTEQVEEPCTYDEQDESSGVWSNVPCSRYREHLGRRDYETTQPPDRPARPREPDHHDFPERDRAGFAQLPGCPRSINPPGDPGRLVETAPASDTCAPQLHYVVPAASSFVLGDNRSNSNDSRFWGPVPDAYVLGTVVSAERGRR